MQRPARKSSPRDTHHDGPADDGFLACQLHLRVSDVDSRLAIFISHNVAKVSYMPDNINLVTLANYLFLWVSCYELHIRSQKNF